MADGSYGAPSPMDVWLNTNVSQVPACPDLLGATCTDLFHKHFITDSELKHHADWYLMRMTCTWHVKVPEYFTNLIGNLTDDFVVQDATTGELSFSTPVCACDSTWGFTGKSCDPNVLGLAVRYSLACVVIWILFLLFRIMMLHSRGKFNTFRKRTLAAVAVLLYLSQLLWIFSTRFAVGLINNTSLRKMIQSFGFTAATLGIFLFASNMMLNTTQFLKSDSSKTKSKANEKSLLWLARIFKILPIFVTTLTIAGTVFSPIRSTAMIVTFVQSLAFLFSAAAFTVAIRVIDLRVRRLVPREEMSSNPTSSKFSSISARLRSTARRMQLASVGTVIVGSIYITSLLAKSVRFGVLPQALFTFWQFVVSFIPFVGLQGLVVLNVKATLKNKMGTRAKETTSKVGSSDYGTLGG